MIDLTDAQLADARANDLEATAAVIRSTDQRVVQLANKYAADADMAEDFAQIGRIAVWQAISECEGTTVAQFFAYVDSTVSGLLSNERKSQTRQGVSREMASNFERCLSASGGDPSEAQRLMTTDFLGHRKATPESALAARLSWAGTDSLDRPWQSGDNSSAATLGDFVAAELSMPAELVELSDIERHRKGSIRSAVHATLGKLSGRMSGVLMRDYGIGNVPYYGDEVSANDAEMAKDMGLTSYQVQQARTNGRKRFRELYLKGSAA